MSLRPNFSVQYVNERLIELDGKLDEKITAFIAGGTVMTVEGLKEGTKDIDIVVETSEDVSALQSGLRNLGYSSPSKGLEIVRHEGRPPVLLENKERFRWDIFQNVVAGKFHLSPGMKQRALPYSVTGNKLRVKLLSLGDVFLMKSVTEREGDLQDMAIIAEHGIEWNSIVVESDWQSKHTGRPWENSICNSLKELRTKYGITSPVERKICRLAEKKTLELEAFGADKGRIKPFDQKDRGEDR